MTRRKFIFNTSLLFAGTVLLPGKAWGADDIRTLNLYNIHTNDSLDVAYYKNGKYITSALSDINKIMVDRRSGDIASMNPLLLDTLSQIQTLSGNDKPIEIICGYRSPKTNAKMAGTENGVAKHSYHTRAMAADISIDGVALEKLHAIAQSLNAGGVGYYPHSGFIHVDVGPIRNWIG